MARQKKLPNTGVKVVGGELELPAAGPHDIPSSLIADRLVNAVAKSSNDSFTGMKMGEPSPNVYDLIREIQKERVTIRGNKSGVFPGSDERYWWATEDLIMAELHPLFEKYGIYPIFHFEYARSGDNVEGVIRMRVSCVGEPLYYFESELPIGEVKSNIDFTARCTTIRRDMLAMTFGVVVVPPVAEPQVVEPTSDTSANDQLAPTDPAESVKPITAIVTPTTTAPVTPPAPAQPETPYDIAARMINAAPNADNLEMIRTQVRNSSKLTQSEKDELLILSQRKYDQSFK